MEDCEVLKSDICLIQEDSALWASPIYHSLPTLQNTIHQNLGAYGYSAIDGQADSDI